MYLLKFLNKFETRMYFLFILVFPFVFLVFIFYYLLNFFSILIDFQRNLIFLLLEINDGTTWMNIPTLISCVNIFLLKTFLIIQFLKIFSIRNCRMYNWKIIPGLHKSIPNYWIWSQLIFYQFQIFTSAIQPTNLYFTITVLYNKFWHSDIIMNKLIIEEVFYEYFSNCLFVV